jgi:hypothetical protein
MYFRSCHYWADRPVGPRAGAGRTSVPTHATPGPVEIQFFDWMAGASGDVCPFFVGGHALGAAFNQLVRSRAQLL